MIKSPNQTGEITNIQAPGECQCVVKNREEGESEREWFKRWMCMHHWMQTDYYQLKTCDHKFVDSNVCLKCGISMDELQSKNMNEAWQDVKRKTTKARRAVDALRDFARMMGMDHFKRDPLVMDIHRALDAAEELGAADTQQIAALQAENEDLKKKLENLEEGINYDKDSSI